MNSTATYLCVRINFVSQDNNNTFQIILATDGQISFVVYLYEDIRWEDVITVVGFNRGDGIKSFTVDVDFLQLPSLSNIDKPGVFLYRVDGNEVEDGPLSSKFLRRFKVHLTVLCPIA